MPVMRFSPGELAPRAGSYELVLEWGERAGVEAQMQRGKRLPAVSVPSDGELWWVEREPTNEAVHPQRSAARRVLRRTTPPHTCTAGAALPVRA